MVEREAPGGQAGTSSRIENYLGFPNGVSGDELASRALQQARRLGAEILVTRTVAGSIRQAARSSSTATSAPGAEPDPRHRRLVAAGRDRRRRPADRQGRLLRRGAQRGASTQGQDIFLIGAGNSAGQAALHFANHARPVTLVVRGDSLAKSMSHYLIDQIAGKANIAARLSAEVRPRTARTTSSASTSSTGRPAA